MLKLHPNLLGIEVTDAERFTRPECVLPTVDVANVTVNLNRKLKLAGSIRLVRGNRGEVREVREVFVDPVNGNGGGAGGGGAN